MAGDVTQGGGTGPTDNDLKRRKIPCITYGTDLSQRVHVLATLRNDLSS